MKRIAAALISVLLLFTFCLPAAARDLTGCEEQVLKAFKEDIETVNGRVLLPSRDIAQIKKIFQNYEVSEADCTELLDALEQVRAILGPLDFKSYEDIPADQRKALRMQMERMGAALSASFESDGVRFRLIRDGLPIFEESMQVVVPVKPEENLGVSVAIVVLLVAGVAFAVIGSKKFEAGK